MGTPRIRCTVVEVQNDHTTTADAPVVRELAPWADPFIAQLVDRYRLRAALDDSLQFLQAESDHETQRTSRFAQGQLPRGGRFHSLFDDWQERPNNG